MNKTYLRF